jgi:Putative auto-transporter adhesin, head GIN domain
MSPLSRPRFALITMLLATLSAGLLVLAPTAEAATTGSGRSATEARAIGEFEAIAVTGSIDVTVRQAPKEAVEVRADDNLLPLIETLVEDRGGVRTLLVRFKRGESLYTRSAVVVAIDAVKLSSLALSGSGDAKVEVLRTPSLKLSISGSGDAAFRGLTTEVFEVRIAGSGDVRAEGSARQVRLSIAGSGDAALGDLVADDVRVSIAGSGDAKVNAVKALDVTIAGSGDVEYTGSPPALKTTVAGSGAVRRR